MILPGRRCWLAGLLAVKMKLTILGLAASMAGLDLRGLEQCLFDDVDCRHPRHHGYNFIFSSTKEH